MSDFITSKSVSSQKNGFIVKTFSWMFFALLISAVSALITAIAIVTNPFVAKALFGNRAIGFIVLAIGEIALVWYLSANLRKLSVTAAKLCFITYSIINGITLSSIFIVYNLGSISFIFVATALMFGAMSLYGAVTKTNLATAGSYLLMGLLGIIIVSVVNFLITLITGMTLSWLDWLISFVTVIIFAGLTAYDTQRIAKVAGNAIDSDDYKKIAIYGALQLYLDFINIFLSLLRLFGKKN